MNIPNNPHAIVEISKEVINGKTGKPTSELLLIYDSWEHEGLFKNVKIELTNDLQSIAVLELADIKKRVLRYISKEVFQNPLIFRFWLGFGQELGEPMFKGILSNIENEEAATKFTVYDMGIRMKLTKKAAYHNKKDDFEILKILAERNGLLFNPPPKKKNLGKHRAYMQDGQTDWELAFERASDSGLHLFVRQDTLFARYPAELETPKLTLVNRETNSLLRDYYFSFDTPENTGVRPQRISVRARGKGGKRLEATIEDESERPREVDLILKRSFANNTLKKTLKARAQAQKDLNREHAFEATVKFLWIYPDIRLDVRDTVRLGYFGDIFSQDYICDTVEYNFAPGKMDCKLDLYRDYPKEFLD